MIVAANNFKEPIKEWIVRFRKNSRLGLKNPVSCSSDWIRRQETHTLSYVYMLSAPASTSIDVKPFPKSP